MVEGNDDKDLELEKVETLTADASDDESEVKAEAAEGVPDEEEGRVFDLKNLLGARKKLEDEAKKLRNESDALKDRLQRISAEYDNFRKRSQKEKEGIYTDSVADVVKEILPVLDSLEKAMEFEKLSENGINKGVELTLGLFRNALEKLGVEEIRTDEGFDPSMHEAVMHVQDESYGTNQVVDVFMKGYRRNEKIIRYSVVKVAN